jgi:hypothetical protein
VQSLLENGWIKIIGAGNRVSTSYRVVLPREKGKHEEKRETISDPQILTLKNRASQSEDQNLTLKNSGSKSDPPEGQFSAPQNLTERTEEIINSNSDRHLNNRPSNFDPQNIPPLLRSFTNRSLTIGEREYDPQILTPPRSLILSARELVEKFYSLLGQRVSKTKREKSIQDCLGLLQEGFAVEEVDYALSWLIQHHPTTGSFSRLAHFIDQALKERAVKQDALEIKQRQILERERERAEQERKEKEDAQLQRRIEEAKAILSPEHLTELQEEAQELVRQEHPNITLGQQILVQIKIDDLIKTRYL